MKAKKTIPAPVQPEITIASLKDAGYKFAGLKATGRAIAQWIMEFDSTFVDAEAPSKVNEKTSEGLIEGFTLKFHENFGSNVYQSSGELNQLILIGNTVRSISVGGKMIPPMTSEFPKGAVTYGIHNALAYTPSQFGQLKRTDPVKHSALEPIWSAHKKYVSNAMSDLLKDAREIRDEREGKAKAKRTELIFKESFDNAMDALEKRVKNAEKRKDSTANSALFAVCLAEFRKNYFK